MNQKLEKALEEARAISYEAAQNGGNGAIDCDECHNPTFVVQGSSDDGAVDYGYCLYCGHTVSYDTAEDEAFNGAFDRYMAKD